MPLDYEQFSIIIVGLICMGAGTGFERSLLPRMAVHTFHQQSAATRLNFVASFGASKAVANAVSGPFADKFGRKPTLVLGFLIGLPVMPYVIVANSWTGITVMNIAFGFSQGLLGSALFFLLIDLLGPSRRGIAVGIGECVIYVSTAIINVMAGDLATKYGFRPVPFYVATAFGVVGLLSTIPLKDTLDLAHAEQLNSDSEYRMRLKYARMASMQPSVLDEENPLLSPQHSPQHSFRTVSEIGNSVRKSYRSFLFAGEKKDDSSSDEEEEEEEDDYLQAESDPPLKAMTQLLFHNPNYVALCFTGMIMNFKVRTETQRMHQQHESWITKDAL